MQKLVITGGIPLEGTVTLQGAKNSVLPILGSFAALPWRNCAGKLSPSDGCFFCVPDSDGIGAVAVP